MGRWVLVGIEEIMNIRMEVCEFESQITTFDVQSASLFAESLMHVAKPKFQ